HGALLDPATEDLPGRGLELLGTLGHGPDRPAAQRALGFIRKTQHETGAWYGRWGVNYIYGTWSVLRGLGAIGEDCSADYIQRAIAGSSSGRTTTGAGARRSPPTRTRPWPGAASPFPARRRGRSWASSRRGGRRERPWSRGSAI